MLARIETGSTSPWDNCGHMADYQPETRRFRRPPCPLPHWHLTRRLWGRIIQVRVC